MLSARNLRMTCRWVETSRVLDELTTAYPDPGEIRAEALMLKAEVALCGPAQDTTRCIQLCDAVAAMSTNSEVQSRAFGHRGLAHLAAYEIAEAEHWLTRAIDAARTAGHPYVEYEALHWLSKKTMACLELGRSWGLLEQLARMSQTSGVASENPPHLRDSSRVLGLQHRYPEAAEGFARYLDVSLPAALGRVTATLAFQLWELDELYGPAASNRLVAELRGVCREEILAPDRCALLADHLIILGRRSPGWDPVLFTVAELGVSQADTQAADAIFRFDVPSLTWLRSLPGTGVGA
ncbi:hypothetical protein ACFVUS_27855 [Nocardia sp. NPDC058058]|uniref:hypothetical protein n=1 Tax=Nocardia sp. NPDC058058 TaxID=3346317 RepID=UPI0036DE4A0D